MVLTTVVNGCIYFGIISAVVSGRQTFVTLYQVQLLYFICL
jgi:hypothetical protein